MEKVLRKVKCSEGLPKKHGRYAFVYYPKYSRYDNHVTNYYYTDMTKETTLNMFEYWYEEVCIDELEDYKMLMKSNLHLREMNAKLQEDDTKEANNRYEKACNSSNNLIQYNHVSEYYYLLWYDVHKVLKIAAGLEENNNKI